MLCYVNWPHICNMCRCEGDLKGMIARYGSAELVAEHFGEKIRTVAYNERSVQCKQIKQCWLSKANPEFRLAENILEHELDKDPDAPSRVSGHLKDTVESVQQLQRLIVSPEMYNNKVLYDLFCSGLESGFFRGSHSRRCSDIRKLITAAHEAHFRTELWFALSKKSFRHNPYKRGNKTRVKLFKEALAAVKVGRENCLAEAIKIRKTGMLDDNLEQDELDADYSSDDAVAVDEDML
jgi:hypothetical protein